MAMLSPPLGLMLCHTVQLPATFARHDFPVRNLNSTQPTFRNTSLDIFELNIISFNVLSQYLNTNALANHHGTQSFSHWRRAVEVFLKGYWEISTHMEWHWEKETFVRRQRNVDYHSGTI
jgi:hypothetical protein